MTVAVDDLARVRSWYEGALGRPAEDIRREDLDGAGFRVRVGPHTFDIVAPQSPRSPLREWLDRRGASPYAATLRTTADRRGPLDPTLTLGARLALVPEAP